MTHPVSRPKPASRPESEGPRKTWVRAGQTTWDGSGDKKAKVGTEGSDVAPPDCIRFPVTQPPAEAGLHLQDGGGAPRARGFPGQNSDSSTAKQNYQTVV